MKSEETRRFLLDWKKKVSEDDSSYVIMKKSKG